MRGIESGIVYTRFLTRRIDHVPGHAWPDTSGSSFASSTAVMQVGCTSARMIYEVFHTVSAMSNLPALLRALKKTLRSVSDPSLSLHSIVSSRPFHWTSLYIWLYWKNRWCAGWKQKGNEGKERKVWGEKSWILSFFQKEEEERGRKNEKKRGKGRRRKRRKIGRATKYPSNYPNLIVEKEFLSLSLSLSLSWNGINEDTAII